MSEMTKTEALEYCSKNAKQFIKDMTIEGGDGEEEFENLISCLESGHIKPNEISDYGMEY